MVHGRRVGGCLAGLCRLSLAFHGSCHGSANVRRSNSGQQVYAGHICSN